MTTDSGQNNTKAIVKYDNRAPDIAGDLRTLEFIGYAHAGHTKRLEREQQELANREGKLTSMWSELVKQNPDSLPTEAELQKFLASRSAIHSFVRPRVEETQRWIAIFEHAAEACLRRLAGERAEPGDALACHRAVQKIYEITGVERQTPPAPSARAA
ncbi:MAG: hypothetical protein L6Q57_01080 [Alphaproteobacteria bacterium]|nr:hypothetical protein [Alphaproteobacteria bacterium]